MELVALALGLCVIGMLLLQVPVLVYGTVQRARSQQVQRQLELREWNLRVKSAEALLERAESSKLSWTGWRKFEVRKKIIENKAGDICSFYFYPHDRKKLPPSQRGVWFTERLRMRRVVAPEMSRHTG